ncbi:hypothetical protein BDAP_002161 [Binucleata daphniae]
MYLYIFCIISHTIAHNYGIELELNNFEPIESPEGFEASFTLNVAVSYRNFKLMKKGIRKEVDRLLYKLNNEFSMSSEQKKGSTFTIVYPCNLNDFTIGKYYFMLDDNTGNSYRSNIFLKNKYNKYQIQKPTGKMKIEKNNDVWYKKYRYYMISLGFVLLILLGFGLYKIFGKNKIAPKI